MKAQIEFYDGFGCLLHSDLWYRPRDLDVTDMQDAIAKVGESLTQWGRLYERARTITIRLDDPARLFPVTQDLRNPHWIAPETKESKNV